MAVHHCTEEIDLAAARDRLVRVVHQHISETKRETMLQRIAHMEEWLGWWGVE